MVASSEDGSTVEQDAIALKHPSPIYVLDGSLYRDDEASPMKKIMISLLSSLNATVLPQSIGAMKPYLRQFIDV
uniref:Uncharacterized protein n=1 Tax=Cucumis melo TaxID=3656 RepID=A0A9I9ED40_CUCME